MPLVSLSSLFSLLSASPSLIFARLRRGKRGTSGGRVRVFGLRHLFSFWLYFYVSFQLPCGSDMIRQRKEGKKNLDRTIMKTNYLISIFFRFILLLSNFPSSWNDKEKKKQMRWRFLPAYLKTQIKPNVENE